MCLEESQRGGAEVKEEMNLIKFNNNFTYFIFLLKNSSSLSLSKVEKVKVFHQIKFVPLFFICFRIYFLFLFLFQTRENCPQDENVSLILFYFHKCPLIS